MSPLMLLKHFKRRFNDLLNDCFICALLPGRCLYMKIHHLNDKQEIQRKLVEGTIMPFVQRLLKGNPDGLTESLMQHSRIIIGVKDQFLEEPGPYEEGHLLFFESGIAHASVLNQESDSEITTHLLAKHEVMFNADSFFNRSDRTKYIQMLEDGVVLSLSFPRLQLILNNYPQLYVLLFPLNVVQQKQYDHYQHLLKLSVDERVQLFLESKPGIASRVNNLVLAQYLGVCRTSFSTAYAKYCSQKDKI